MRYRHIGKNIPELSRLGIGLMRLPRCQVNGQNIIDEELSIKLIHRAFDLGINYVDTAPGYSDKMSDKILGMALRSYRDKSKKIYIAAKIYPNPTLSSTQYRKAIENSMNDIGINKVDFYHYWCVNIETIDTIRSKPDGPHQAVQSMMREGIIDRLSFSTHDNHEKVKRMIDTCWFSSMLVQYNIIDRRHEKTLEYAKRHGLITMTMGSVAGGKLNGPPTGETKKLLGEAKYNPSEIALRFVLANQNVDLALSGMNMIEMIEDNCRIIDNDSYLTDSEVYLIKRISNQYRALADLYCTGCDYCKPCPAGINIPEIFNITNYHNVFNMTNLAKGSYRGIMGDGYYTKSSPISSCIDCGACERRCPQGIKIREQLRETHRLLNN